MLCVCVCVCMRAHVCVLEVMRKALNEVLQWLCFLISRVHYYLTLSLALMSCIIYFRLMLGVRAL